MYFTFVVACYYLVCVQYASLCNAIKLVNILCKYAASKQKRFIMDQQNDFIFRKENVVKEKKVFLINS